MYSKISQFISSKNLVNRYFIVLSIIIITGVSIRTANEYINLENEIKEEARHYAQSTMQVVNMYKKTYDEIMSKNETVLNQFNVQFIPEHALTLIKNFQDENTSHNLFIRNVTNNAANKGNLANTDEIKIMQLLNKEKSEQMFTSLEFNEKPYYVLAKAMYVKPNCLMCHGKKENAPEFVQRQNKSGYNYQIGDIRAITAIYVDKASFESEYINLYTKRALASLLITILILILLYIAVKKISKQAESLIALLEDTSSKDALTTIANRRTLDISIREIHNNLLKDETPYALLLFDIDFFKKINDTYGHLIGDNILIEISKIFKAHIRKNDILGRWGGEEFLIILPNTSNNTAFLVADKIRKIIESYHFKDVEQITVSCGVYCASKDDSIEETFSNVDEALYMAKESGRNRVNLVRKT